MFNKLIQVILLLALTVSLSISGCGKVNPTSSDQFVEVSKPFNPNLILATTTSTQDSGLLDELIPIFEQKTGYKVKTIAVGTGAALAMGEKGDADVLLVHAPSSEKKLVDNKVATNYQLVMHNDFILVGPSSDPAKVKGKKTVYDVLNSIAQKQSIFISRGDDSGTEKIEKGLWAKFKINPTGSWYQESGSGMGQTLTIASDKAAYTLTDRATFLATQKNLKLDNLFQGEPSLLNIYHVMQVNPDKFPKVNSTGAEAFVNFLVNSETQKTIGDFGKDKFGQSLFFPDAGKTMEDIGN